MIGLLFVLILLDQFSKHFILTSFPDLVVFNQGISFGLIPSANWLIINFLVLTALVCLLPRGRGKTLILSGGLTNLIDRIFRGQVVDFIDFKIWPIFNLADVFICLGVGMLIFSLLYQKLVNRKEKNGMMFLC